MDTFLQIVQDSLEGLYTPEEIAEILAALEKLTTKDPVKHLHTAAFTPRDAVLITYADAIYDQQARRPLQALRHFLKQAGFDAVFPVVHLLPFFPWDCDRGFSVCDFYKVAPENGQWQDVHALAVQHRLMFDFVANHASIQNPLVQAALIERHLEKEDPTYTEVQKYKDFVVAFSEEDCPSEALLAKLARPRAASVLTPYYVLYDQQELRYQAVLGDHSKQPCTETQKHIGGGFVWTTFSRGVDSEGREQTRQVDLNYKNPKVFIEALKIVLFYAQQRAAWVRLDAIGYLWKNLGSASLHEEETHRLLAALHAALAYCAPELLTIAEVNEPQEKVFSYLGEASRPEADLVYQFTHYPLAAHALLRQDLQYYRGWLRSTEVADGRQFVTVLGSHDGMGLKPLRGVLPEEEIQEFAQHLLDECGGLANYARLPGGEQIVYEVCGTAWELLTSDNATSFEQRLARYRVVLALGLVTRGLPAIYLHAALGAKNYTPDSGLDEHRSVNRQRFSISDLTAEFEDPTAEMPRVYEMLQSLLRVRAGHAAFDARGGQLVVYDSSEPYLLHARRSKHGEALHIVVNISQRSTDYVLPRSSLQPPEHRAAVAVKPGDIFVDVLGNEEYQVTEDGLVLDVAPYGVHWLVSKAQLQRPAKVKVSLQ